MRKKTLVFLFLFLSFASTSTALEISSHEMCAIDEMEVDGDIDDEYSEPGSKARPVSDAGKKNRAGRPPSGSSSKNKRQRPPQTSGMMVAPSHSSASVPVPQSPTPLGALEVSQDVLEPTNDNSLDESDAAYNDDDSDDDGKSGRGRTKRKDGKSGKPKRNNLTRSARPTEVAAPDLDFLDESDHGSAHKHATEMWKIVDAHFAELTEEDLRFCQTHERPNDSAFTIPKLGPHFSLTLNSALDRSASRRFLPGGGLDQSADVLMPGAGGIAPESIRGPGTYIHTLCFVVVVPHLTSIT